MADEEHSLMADVVTAAISIPPVGEVYYTVRRYCGQVTGRCSILKRFMSYVFTEFFCLHVCMHGLKHLHGVCGHWICRYVFFF